MQFSIYFANMIHFLNNAFKSKTFNIISYKRSFLKLFFKEFLTHIEFKHKIKFRKNINKLSLGKIEFVSEVRFACLFIYLFFLYNY